MRLDRVDAFFLHTNICEDDTVYAHGNDQRDAFATPWSQYVDEVAPALASLKASGRVGAWGITGVGVPSAILRALAHEVRPDLVQGSDQPDGLARGHAPLRRGAAAEGAHRGRGRAGRRGDGDPGGPGGRADRVHRPDAERDAPRDGRLPPGRAVPGAVRRAGRGPRAARAPLRARHGRRRHRRARGEEPRRARAVRGGGVARAAVRRASVHASTTWASRSRDDRGDRTAATRGR